MIETFDATYETGAAPATITATSNVAIIFFNCLRMSGMLAETVTMSL